MEPLSSFAINIAAGIAMKLWEGLNKNKDVDSQISIAFACALRDWSKNIFIRTRRGKELKMKIKNYISNSDGTYLSADVETIEFLDLFEKRLAEQPAAFNYLQSNNNRNAFNQIKNTVEIIVRQNEEILEQIQLLKEEKKN
ncbi:MAG: hypothetical protein V2A67_04410 [Bacteroidota bacterium]